MPDLSFLGYFMSASPVVEVVIAILLLTSVFSWTIIFQRGLCIGKARRMTRRFQKKFWKTDCVETLYHDVAKKADRNQGMAAIFYAGYHEYLRLKEMGAYSDAAVLDGVERSMRAASSYEEEYLESNLSFLGTVGSTSPYVGLFGTVWGIMTAFHSLGAAQQVTIAMVAPGISEALIATAMGLFAAIPAVIFYNRYVSHSDRILNRYEAFQEEVLNSIHRLMGDKEQQEVRA